MEDNNQNNQAVTQPIASTPTTEPVVTPSPEPTQPVATPMSDQPKKGNKTFLIIFLLILAIITAVMFFLVRNSQTTPQQQEPVTTIPPQITSPAPTATGSAEEQEVESIDVEDTSPTDIPPVEQEVQGL